MIKKRILHIVPNFGTGGAERLVVDLVDAADTQRLELFVVSLYAESGRMLEKEIREKRLAVRFLDKRPGLDLRMIWRLYRTLRNFRPEVVHTHLSVLRYGLLPIVVCRIPARLHTMHNVAGNETDFVGRVVRRIAFRFCNVIPVSISFLIRDTVRQVYGPRVHSPVVYNGIPTQRFVRASQTLTEPDQRLRLIHVGRFAPQKNHCLLLEAFALAASSNPTINLRLVGDGPLKASVERQTIEKQISERVQFLGERDDVPDLLEQSDMFVLSSDWEGMPLTLLEAMAAGKPVIATAVGGVPELVEDGRTGLLVPPKDVNALCKAILQMAEDPALRLHLGKAGQQRAVELFDLSRTAKGYESLYMGLPAGRK